MDDDDEVEKYITAAIGPEERKILTLTSDDETDILSLLPCDAQLCESQPQPLCNETTNLNCLYSYNIKANQFLKQMSWQTNLIYMNLSEPIGIATTESHAKPSSCSPSDHATDAPLS
jgi:hypothetical protein